MVQRANRAHGLRDTRFVQTARATLVALLVLGGAAHASPLTLLNRHGSYVSVEAYGANIVRVTMATEKDLALAPPGYGFSATADNTGWTHSENTAGDVFASSALQVTIKAQPWPKAPSQMQRYFAPSLPPVSLTMRSGESTLLEMTGWEMAPHTVSGEPTFLVGATFAAPADEHYYGLGQNQEGILDLRGRQIDCRHYYDAPAGEQVCVPFMVSNKGYGIVWDNPSATKVYPAVNGKTHWQSEVGERVSFFVIAGRTSDEIYAGYAHLTGATPLPPKAAFGFIQSRARYESQAQILSVAEGYRSRGYPLDIMVLDWFHWTRMGQLDIDHTYFPDPIAMNRTLHDAGIHSMISVWPRFEKESRYFNMLAAKGWFLKDADGKPVDGLPVRSDRAGALLDSTNPEARAWFWDRIRENIASQGFDWFWLDETEPDLVPDGYFYSIGSGERYHNLYPLVHTQGVAEGSARDRPNMRNLILARAAYLGAQRNGALFWSSDVDPSWEALRRQIPTGLNFTASGFAYWGNDIGGWQALPPSHKPEKTPLLDPSDARAVIGDYDDYPELFVRWFQYGVFSPTLRTHGLRSGTEVWSYGKAAETVVAKYLKLRYSLMPYIYSLGRQTYETGAPFMRALFMDFPNDPKVANIGDEYMFGPALLVAPITEQGAERRSVYLPAGSDWYDYWSGQRHAGGAVVEALAPIDRIPLFVRAGSIIPFGSAIANTSSPQTIQSIRVYPGNDASFTLYDDDGITNNYRTRDGRKTLLRWNDQKRSMTINGKSGGEAALRNALCVVDGTSTC